VGPLEDVRLEVAANYDNFEPADLGRCGEPYSPLPVCNKTYGLLAHGVSGVALAGEIRPPDPWNSWKGIEVGARLEWRWNRFSMALMDFYGYNDFPYVDTLFAYSRNVDPVTGRPRQGMVQGSCKTGNEPACLTAGNALAHHSVNQTIFSLICSTSIGFSDLDLTSCGQSVFNSTNPANAQISVATALSSVIAGDPTGLVLNGLVPGILGAVAPALIPGLPRATPLHLLAVDPNDGASPTLAEWNAAGGGQQPLDFVVGSLGGLQVTLTDEQEALLGCGAFYGTLCDANGIDLMNAEASALMQSWPGFEGTFRGKDFVWDTTDARIAQPGTVGFEGGPVCTRYENGKLYILPGCRGPGDPGYDINVDGSTDGDTAIGLAAYQRVQPFTGQPFSSEMAVLSWNLLVGLVAFSTPVDPNNPQVNEFDVNRALRKDGCSLAAPQFCANVMSFYDISGLLRNTVRAAGNGRFGRRDFEWHSGASLALRYEKRNVLGFSMDFAEDVTKSNWGVEATWIEGVPFTDHDKFDGTTTVDTYNLTLSVDRPTFINFLNSNRTFFFNSQWFFQYVDNYRKGFTSNGPWNILATFTIETGFFRDRFTPSMTFVYDIRSNSGAWLPRVTYRYTENFSVTFGIAAFMGRFEGRSMALNPTSTHNHVGRGSYQDFVENGLSVVRERDEAYLRVRYTF
jgi:hypothetical protein